MTCANHPDREQKAFCQNCGKPICAECARTVGQAVFCEPCLELRLSAVNAASPDFQSFGSIPGGVSPASPGFTPGTPYSGGASGIPAPGLPLQPGVPNPGIAFLLGLIPGVGAMYNGQYAKGVVHLIVFAVLVSLAGQNGIFGLFVPAWIIYQAFEAMHTARARRDGTPLPNPFGLNDIGERLGFGKSWPSTSIPVPPPVGRSPEPGPSTVPPRPDAPPASEYTYTGATTSPYSNPVGSPSSANVGSTRPASPWGSPVDTYPDPLAAAPLPPRGSKFPVGAVVLIGLGVLFLLGSTHLFFLFPMRYLLPFLLIGVGVYIFVRRMTASGVSFADDGSAAYRIRLVRALQSSVWVVLVGVLFLLDELHILSWGRSWPLFIILGGVMAFVQRSAYASTAQQTYPNYYPASPVPQPPPAPTSQEPGTSIVPRDGEGS